MISTVGECFVHFLSSSMPAAFKAISLARQSILLVLSVFGSLWLEGYPEFKASQVYIVSFITKELTFGQWGACDKCGADKMNILTRHSGAYLQSQDSGGSSKMFVHLRLPWLHNKTLPQKNDTKEKGEGYFCTSLFLII